MYIKDKLSVIEWLFLRKNIPRNMFFCEVYFLGENAPCGKIVFFEYNIKKEGFIRSGLSLTLDANGSKRRKQIP